MANQINIGVFGGSFDPVHIGHTSLISDIKSKFDLNKVLIVPNYNPPYKNKSFFTNGQRLNMLKIVFNQSDVSVLDYEIRQAKFVPTYKSLSYLQNKFKFAKIFFILGEDSFLSISLWQKYTEILKEYSLIVCNRGECYTQSHQLAHEYKFKYNAKIFFARQRYINISSSYIRNNFNQCSKYLDTNVVNYINKIL